ncbi:MAG: cation diffusion facilitator family transporter [Parachlamydiales bacterium]|jgi:cation diffusion facilitator family transporter
MAKISELQDSKYFVPMAFSALSAIVVLAIKAYAYAVTNSQAIFADFMESLLHIGIVGITSLSLWYAAKPPDREHRYGHGKAAYFSAAFEGLLVLFTGGATLYNAFNSLFRGFTPHNLEMGALLVVVVIVINAVMSYYLIRRGKDLNNIALQSHGYHIQTDMWTSMGVVISLFATWMTGYSWVDSIVGAFLALWILYTGGQVCLQAYQGLMERIDEDVHATVLALLENAVDEKLIEDFHQLRHRRVNDVIWIEVHLLFDGKLTLNEVHRRATVLEVRLIESFPADQVNVMTHLEPTKHLEAHPVNHPDREKPPI